MTKEHLCTYLYELQQEILRSDYFWSCHQLLEGLATSWDSPVPGFFLALPTDLDSWVDLDLTTHSFRLYFLCYNLLHEGVDETIPQSMHFSNHQGYNLKRPLEFFQAHGDHVLKVLQMVKRGYSNFNFEVPPLDTFKILWDYDTEVTGGGISKDTLGSLIDKAVSYLLNLSPPRLNTELLRNQDSEIKPYLDIQDYNSATGNLHRYSCPPFQRRGISGVSVGDKFVYWMCQVHAQQRVKQVALKELKGFAQCHGGLVDMQQATLKVQLGSITEADEFCALLMDTKHTFNISIN